MKLGMVAVLVGLAALTVGTRVLAAALVVNF